MTYDELRDQVARLSEKLDGVSTSDPALLEQRIALRQLQNQMDIAAVPALGNPTPEVDVEALISAVDTDIAQAQKRAALVSQIGQVIGFVKKFIG
ncbi:MAG TPA: hypothetical protein VGQ57_21385 [Polyangiaceae bacterium]|jgi:hypothetical protein|nr:hypothetical protein [Polyangiaceae bacterium]